MAFRPRQGPWQALQQEQAQKKSLTRLLLAGLFVLRTHLNPSPASKGAADKGAVEVDVSFVLEGGQKYRLMDPRQVWGEPVATGTVKGKSITAPVSGDLAGYVVLADQARTDSRSGR